MSWPGPLTAVRLARSLTASVLTAGALTACGSPPPAKVVAPAAPESPLLAPMSRARQAVDRVNAAQEQRDRAIEKAHP